MPQGDRLALSERMNILEGNVEQQMEDLKRASRDRQNIIHNMCYGVGVKVDILQAILLETISMLDPAVKEKVLAPENTERIAERAKAELQKRMDMLGWGDEEGTAPLDQLMEDNDRASSD